jgi:hypothetical protein
MKLMQKTFVSLGILATCIALTSTNGSFARVENQESNEAAKTYIREQNIERNAAPGNQVVIGYLQTRDKIVTISRGPKGAVYTIKTTDGKTLAARLNEKRLQAKYPEIYNQIKSGLAANDATLRR